MATATDSSSGGSAGPRYRADQLVATATALLAAAGMAAEPARNVAEVLVEGDLLGHDTHGLGLLAPYLKELDDGNMTPAGEPLIVAERSAVATWDGNRLPGPHLLRRAIDWARPRAKEHGQATVAIRRSHHIACLAAFLEPVARDGLMIEIYSSDPRSGSVAPFGGTRPLFTPNPMAIGIPTSTEPILIDISASITTNGLSSRLHAAGQKGENAWWLDASGRPTKDPAVLFAKPPGSILPLGGLDAGHKGYGLALLIETFTSALSGRGRSQPAEGWGATVLLRLTDPAAFGGDDAFKTETDWLIKACHDNPPRAEGRPVRLPGERGLKLRREQLSRGVALHPSILPALAPWAARYTLALPEPVAS